MSTVAEVEMRLNEGVVLGRRWGSPPPADGDALPDEVVLLGARWRVAWSYEAGALVAVGLQLIGRAGGGFDVALVDAIDRASRIWLGRPLVARDEAYWVAEAGATRLTWDGLDGRLAFEDSA